MSDELVVICPELAPGSGGLADHTQRLVTAWRDRFALRFIVPKREPPEPPTHLTVDVIERNRAALRAKLPAKGGKVFLQYSAYGFDHFGYPRWLLSELADWKANPGGVLVILLHEIWTFWPVLNKNYLIQKLHRRDLRALIARADALFTSTASQAEHLGELLPGANVAVLPVGSNITPTADLQRDREMGLAVLFGLQGARLRALRQMATELKALASSSVLNKIIAVGGANTTEADDEERLMLDALPLQRGHERVGSIAEEEISALLARASFGLSVQDELSLTKSSTFMAYAVHELNVLSPYGEPGKPEPLCWLTRPAELLRDVSATELRERAAHLRAWQERTASWSTIADRLATALSL